MLLFRHGQRSIVGHKLPICLRLLIQAHDGNEIFQIPVLCFGLLRISETACCAKVVCQFSVQPFPMQCLLKLGRIRNQVGAANTQRPVIASWTEPCRPVSAILTEKYYVPYN